MRTDRREALIGRFIIITHRRGAVAAGDFSGVADACVGAAFAPLARNRVTSECNCGKRGGGY